MRPDDNYETMKVRLDAYNKQTAPLVDYYRSKSILRSVDGLQSVDVVASELRRVIGMVPQAS